MMGWYNQTITYDDNNIAVLTKLYEIAMESKEVNSL